MIIKKKRKNIKYHQTLLMKKFLEKILLNKNWMIRKKETYQYPFSQ